MNQPVRLITNKRSVVLVIDSLELRRAGVVSFLTPWASESNVVIVQIDHYEALTQPNASLLKMILLVIGARGVADPETRSLITSLHSAYASTPLVLVSECEGSDEVVAAFKAGVRGFIPMSFTPSIAIQAFTFIMSGGSFFPPTALMQCTHVTTSVSVVAGIEDTPRFSLTVRQQNVFERLRLGESNKLIGRQLNLRESTVKVHIRQILRKLGATNRTQAALCATDVDPLASDENGARGSANEAVSRTTRIQ
jgi:DNA-binding NarL/FixJ family response regulator